MVKINKMSQKDVDLLEQKALNVFACTERVFGNANFRIPTDYTKGRINIAVMETIFNCFYQSDVDLQNIDLSILEILNNSSNNKITSSKIAEILGFSVASTKRHLIKLIRLGLVYSEGNGKNSFLHTNFSSIVSEFTFDYSNNNGVFDIGSGDYLFSTKWSKASDTSIHAYSDCNTITSIGRIKNVENISNISISDIENVDFSSRCRTANINDIIVWKNIYGKIAVTKIINIKDDSRNDSVDEVKCQYKIFFE